MSKRILATQQSTSDHGNVKSALSGTYILGKLLNSFITLLRCLQQYFNKSENIGIE